MMRNAIELRCPAKLNLFLHIIGRRHDGYHLLQSVFQLIDWCDLLTLKRIPENEVRRIDPIPGVPPEQDLVVRAAQLLKEHCKIDQGVEIGLQKNIPMGAGLGGGSSDAASTLIGLNSLWDLHLDIATLCQLGLKLGADVPFFIFGQNAFVEGVGEITGNFPGNPRLCGDLPQPGDCHCSDFSRPSIDPRSRSDYNRSLSCIAKVISAE
jgi:4-diphosphocytidyl-2-C-methyl-D-erythritol kinase